jgi:hypothetical protein
MPSDFETLPELIRTRSAQYGIPRRTLCKWAFDGILDGFLVPQFGGPNKVTLDTEIQGSTYRKQIEAMLVVLDNPRTCPWTWLNAIELRPRSFDQWIKRKIGFDQQKIPQNPQASEWRPGPGEDLRDAIRHFAEAKYGLPLPSHVTHKQIAKDYTAETDLSASERTVRRAFGEK